VAGISNLSFGFRGVTNIRESKIICDNLVFNKTPEATDDMLERTEYEPACNVTNACLPMGRSVHICNRRDGWTLELTIMTPQLPRNNCQRCRTIQN
jgi:hypothetical protein